MSCGVYSHHGHVMGCLITPWSCHVVFNHTMVMSCGVYSHHGHVMTLTCIHSMARPCLFYHILNTLHAKVTTCWRMNHSKQSINNQYAECYETRSEDPRHVEERLDQARQRLDRSSTSSTIYSSLSIGSCRWYLTRESTSATSDDIRGFVYTPTTDERLYDHRPWSSVRVGRGEKSYAVTSVWHFMCDDCDASSRMRMTTAM